MIDPNPFANFHHEKAEKILAYAESICVDEIDAAAHFAACLIGLAPNREAHLMLDYVEHNDPMNL